MLTHEEMIGLQAEKHELIDAHSFRSREEYVLHLIHSFAYVQASMLAEGKTVLDLGCNTGYGSEILFKTAKRVVSVDISATAISTAKKLYGHLGIDFRLIDGKQLPFNDNEFDMGGSQLAPPTPIYGDGDTPNRSVRGYSCGGSRLSENIP